MARQGFDWRYEDPQATRATLIRADQTLGELIQSDAFEAIRRARFGSMVYPGVLALAFAGVLAGLVAMRGLQRTESESPTPTGWMHFAEGIGFIVLFILLVRPVGFVLTAGVLLGLLFWRLGVTPVRAAALTAVVVLPAYLLFHVLLRVDLPRGLLGW
jgi:hypothetical protein